MSTSPPPRSQPVNPPPASPQGAAELTLWLQSLGPASAQASSEVFALLYADLHRMARQQLGREAAGHTLAPTGLLHEAWLRMAQLTRTPWQNRSHFLATACVMMRRILVDHAQAQRAEKRGGGQALFTLTGITDLGLPDDRDVVAVHEALLALEAEDARAAKVVELRFFGGLENDEVAQVLGISVPTVKRDWVFARAWLHQALSEG